MSHWLISLCLLALAALSFGIWWQIRKSGRDGWLYFLASLAILFFTASLLIWAPAGYQALGGLAFFPEGSGTGAFDTQSYSGFLQVLFGVPVAVAGSLYAILLARQSERQSTQFNAYEIRKNFRDRLDGRNAIVGRFAKALRDVNNTSYILLARVERALASLPEDAGAQEGAARRIGKETEWIEADGLPMLRSAFEDYRNASIAVQEGGIRLDTRTRAPLDTIRWHFFPKGAEQPPEFIKALFTRDYQAAADRFVLRAYRLNAQDLVRAHLERISQFIVRESEKHRKLDWTRVCDAIVSGTADSDADVSDTSDFVGFRFIGPALIRADACTDRQSFAQPACRIDFGTAMLLDSYLALPNEDLSAEEAQGWEEWEFLQDLPEIHRRDVSPTVKPSRSQHFPHAFSNEVRDVEALYDYAPRAAFADAATDQPDAAVPPPLPDPAAQAEEATRERLATGRALAAITDHRTLFYHMPPSWMDSAYEDLAAQVCGPTPPLRRALLDHLACMAVGVQIVRMNSARDSSMAAIDRIAAATGAIVDTEFARLGSIGQREHRRYLLVRWARQPAPAARREVLARLQRLAEAPADTAMAVQLQFDLHDCHMALGDAGQAAACFDAARRTLETLAPDDFFDTKWFGNYHMDDRRDWLEPQIVLLALWLGGWLSKQLGDFTFGGNPLSETEIAMPMGFLPAVWALLVLGGQVRLPGGARPVLVAYDASFLSHMVKPGQGEWEWDPQEVARAMARRLDAIAPAGEDRLPDALFDDFKEKIESGKIAREVPGQ